MRPALHAKIKQRRKRREVNGQLEQTHKTYHTSQL